MTTTNHPIVIDTPNAIKAVRLLTMLRGVEFEAKAKAEGRPMLFTRVGGGATRIAKREFGLPKSAKPDAICAVIRAALAEIEAKIAEGEG
jgi:hypothetical protein